MTVGEKGFQPLLLIKMNPGINRFGSALSTDRAVPQTVLCHPVGGFAISDLEERSTPFAPLRTGMVIAMLL